MHKKKRLALVAGLFSEARFYVRGSMRFHRMKLRLIVSSDNLIVIKGTFSSSAKSLKLRWQFTRKSSSLVSSASINFNQEFLAH